MVRPTKRIIRTPTLDEPTAPRSTFTKGRYGAATDDAEVSADDVMPAVSKYDGRPAGAGPAPVAAEPRTVPRTAPADEEVEIVVDLRDTSTGFEGTFEKRGVADSAPT